MKHTLSLLLAALLALPLAVRADQLPGEAKAFKCTGCHGPAGMKSAPGQPAIGGRPAEDLVAILLDYQRLRRINPAMQALLLGMDDADLEDVAEFFSLAGGAVDTAYLR
ncbi:MAG: hypothetical protein PHS77_12460 [Gallionellaceae bacterium]|nr:hypothetical protein [Gallionellaceae bacterium]